MNLLFIGGLFSKEQEKQVLKYSKYMPNFAANVHQWNIIKGLKMDVSIINPLFLGNYPNEYRKAFIKKEIWSHDGKAVNISPSTVNIFGLKQIFRFFSIKKEIVKWMKYHDPKDSLIVIYSMNSSFISSFLSANKKNKTKFKSCLIVPDLPFFYIKNKGKNGLYRFLKTRDWNHMLKQTKNIDSFVLLTDQMRGMLGVNGKPYLVCEGIAPSSYAECVPIVKNTITYTGTLDEEFGILDLIEAFLLCNRKDWVLRIAGDGNAHQAVAMASMKNSNVKYLGVLSNNDTRQIQSSSYLLVNPRKSNEEFTKYSFPSKTMEYLISGRPILMYKLQGIPDEYDKYLYYFDGLDIESMSRKLKEIMDKPETELFTIGKRGKSFVENEKSVDAQGSKLSLFFEKIVAESFGASKEKKHE